MHDIEHRTLRVIAEISGIAPQCIQPHHTMADLQCDSLDCVELALALEEDFGIDINQDEFERLQTVQQIVGHVAGVCTVKEAAAQEVHVNPASLVVSADRVKTLMSVTLAVILELDGIKNAETPLSQKEKNRLTELVERGHDALQALGMKYDGDDSPEDDIEQARRLGSTQEAGHA